MGPQFLRQTQTWSHDPKQKWVKDQPVFLVMPPVFLRVRRRLREVAVRLLPLTSVPRFFFCSQARRPWPSLVCLRAGRGGQSNPLVGPEASGEGETSAETRAQSGSFFWPGPYLEKKQQPPGGRVGKGQARSLTRNPRSVSGGW